MANVPNLFSTQTGPIPLSQIDANFASFQSSSGADSIGFIQAGTGVVSRTVQSKFRDTVSAKDFGAVGDGVTDDTTAMINFFNFCLLGNKGIIPKGIYKVTSAITLDMTICRAAGFSIEGDGVQDAVIDLSSVTSVQPFSVINTNVATGAFYGTLRNFGIRTNYNGVGVKFGNTTLTDALNVMDIRLWVSNTNAGAAACAVEINFVVNSHIYLVANCLNSTVGEALRLKQSQFNVFEGSFSNALTSVHITSGYNFGNIFNAPDVEVSGTNLVIDSVNSINNTFIGGQWQWVTASINATQGNNNRVIGANFASAGTIASSSVGLIVYGKAIGAESLGGLNITPSSGDSILAIDSVAGNVAQSLFKNAGVIRWGIARDTSNNLLFNRYNSSGVVVDTPFYI